MPTPNGYSEVVRMFGKPFNEDMALNKVWERDHIISYEPPFDLYYADKKVSSIRVHKLLVPFIDAAFNSIWNYARICTKKEHASLLAIYKGTDLTKKIDNLTQDWLNVRGLTKYGGAYVYRAKRGSIQLSMHSFGIAIDIDPEGNPLGATSTTFPKWFINCWKKAGFTWGGNFKGRKDPQHFQYAKGC